MRSEESKALAPLLSVRELSELLQVSVSTLYEWRVIGQGPRGIKVGGHLRFDPHDVDEWLRKCKAESSRAQERKREWASRTDGLKTRLKRHRDRRRW